MALIAMGLLPPLITMSMAPLSKDPQVNPQFFLLNSLRA